MAPWSPERVAALAPDPASASAGQALANVRKWAALGRSDRAIWGLCQGSGRQPYQARVDLAEPAFKCSCPEPQVPVQAWPRRCCSCSQRTPRPFASETSRTGSPTGSRSAWPARRKKTEQAETAVDKPVDLESQAKRAAQREARVRDGVAGCRVWLEDLVRRGLAAAQSDPAADWERAAARLVDAQAPGLASFIRRIPMMMASGPGWDTAHGRSARQTAPAPAAPRSGSTTCPPISPSTCGRRSVGRSPAKMRWPRLGVADRWIAIGQVIEEEERFRVARTWLVGQDTGRRALILDFAAGSQPLDRSIVAGSSFDGELAFYPSRQPLRALLKSRSETLPIDPDFAQAGRRDDRSRTAALCRGARVQPVDLPLAARARRRRGRCCDGSRWFLVDAQDHGLPRAHPRLPGVSSCGVWFRRAADRQ